MQLQILKSVTVVTPTIGTEKLKRAVDSIQAQTYQGLTHLLVIDGSEHSQKVVSQLPPIVGGNIKTMVLPYNVGGKGFYGHRVYAAISHLLNCDYVSFLDEDNWVDPDHIQTLVSKIDGSSLDFVYSLRKIWSSDMTESVLDECESLGVVPVWPALITGANVDSGNCLIDTSSFMFRRDFLLNYGHIWHHGWGADRRFLSIVKQEPINAKFKGTGMHTLNYRLDGNPNSVTMDFFKEGNKTMADRFPNKPWKN